MVCRNNKKDFLKPVKSLMELYLSPQYILLMFLKGHSINLEDKTDYLINISIVT